MDVDKRRSSGVRGLVGDIFRSSSELWSLALAISRQSDRRQHGSCVDNDLVEVSLDGVLPRLPLANRALIPGPDLATYLHAVAVFVIAMIANASGRETILPLLIASVATTVPATPTERAPLKGRTRLLNTAPISSRRPV